MLWLLVSILVLINSADKFCTFFLSSRIQIGRCSSIRTEMDLKDLGCCNDHYVSGTILLKVLHMVFLVDLISCLNLRFLKQWNNETLTVIAGPNMIKYCLQEAWTRSTPRGLEEFWGLIRISSKPFLQPCVWRLCRWGTQILNGSQIVMRQRQKPTTVAPGLVGIIDLHWFAIFVKDAWNWLMCRVRVVPVVCFGQFWRYVPGICILYHTMIYASTVSHLYDLVWTFLPFFFGWDHLCQIAKKIVPLGFKKSVLSFARA